MYGFRYQSVPVHFSFNGSSSRRIATRHRQISTQPEQPPVQRTIRSPHKSRWSMATDLVILQMVVIRQIHPEKAEVCWQGIADTLVQRGYVEAGLPAGAVKSRFFSILHKSMLPLPLNASKVYDTIAILFHDELPVPSHLPDSSQSKKPTTLVLPTDCANSHFADKSHALRYLDQASLKGHCAQALGIHYSQRPDMVARRRQIESLQTQSSQCTHIIMDSQKVPEPSRLTRQLPTPAASSDPCTVQSSLRPKPSDQIAPNTQKAAVKSDLERSKSNSLISNDHDVIRKSQLSQKSRKRAHSPSSEANQVKKRPRVKKESEATVPTLETHVDMNAVFRAESVAAAKFRADQIRALQERRLKSNNSNGRLYLSAVHPTIFKYKRETCFMRYRLGSQILNPDGIGLPAKPRSSGKKRRKRRSKAQQPSELQKPHIKKESRAKTNAENKVRSKVEKKNLTRTKNPKRTYIELPSSPISSDRTSLAEELSQASSESSRLGKLVQRIRTKEAANLPVVDGKVVAKVETFKNKKDVVQEIYERVKQNRIDKAIQVSRGSIKDIKSETDMA